MNKFLTAGVACAMLCAGLSSALAQVKTQPTKPGTGGNGITISCYRGPTTGVVWDRANAVFVDDLVKFGYTYPQAHAIGDRICRDEWGVNKPEYLRTSLLKIMADTPPRR